MNVTIQKCEEQRCPVPPPPSRPFGSGGGGTQSLAGEGVGGPNSDEGTDTVLLYEYMCLP
jgi:hypothetical protein